MLDHDDRFVDLSRRNTPQMKFAAVVVIKVKVPLGDIRDQTNTAEVDPSSFGNLAFDLFHRIPLGI